VENESWEPPDRLIRNGITYHVKKDAEVWQFLLPQKRWLLTWINPETEQEHAFILSESVLRAWTEEDH